MLKKILINFTIIGIIYFIFIYFDNNAIKSRDSTRLVDLHNISKALSTKAAPTGIYIEPWEILDNWKTEEIEWYKWVKWIKWKFWKEQAKKTWYPLSVDPKTKNLYDYYISEDKKYILLQSISEYTWEKIIVTNYKKLNNKINESDDLKWTNEKDEELSNYDCNKNWIYLESNGITIKAKKCIEAWRNYEFNWLNYYVARNKTDLTNKIFLEGFPANRIITSKVTTLYRLFENKTEFNQDISSWDTSNVITMYSMFNWATSFNQDLTSWNVIKIKTEPYNFSYNSALISENKPLWWTIWEKKKDRF